LMELMAGCAKIIRGNGRRGCGAFDVLYARTRRTGVRSSNQWGFWTTGRLQGSMTARLRLKVAKVSYDRTTGNGHTGKVAEWSKAPCSGRGPKGRGFESHLCHMP